MFYTSNYVYRFVRFILLLVGLLSIAACGGGSDANSSSGYPQCNVNPVYVHYLGDDTNMGTINSPFATIEKALSCAYEQEVRVAEGSYDILSALTQAPDVTLLGGYSSDFSQRDPLSYPTVINVDITPLPAITAEFGEALKGRIDGFIFNDNRIGKYTLISSRVFVSNNIFNCTGTCVAGGYKEIYNNTMNGGDVVLAVSLGGTKIRNNYISTSVPNAIGISTTHSEVYDNIIEIISGGEGIRAGSGPVSSNMIQINNGVGIYGLGGGDIFNNVVLLTGTSEGIIHAHHKSFEDTIISNNTIIGENGGVYEGIDLWVKQAILSNNIVSLGSGTCITELTISSDPVEVRNNNLYGCAIHYQDEGTSSYTTISEVNSMLDTDASNNISVNSVLNSSDGSLTVSSPVFVTQGGLNISSYFTIDYNGNTRTEPWSIGAYEFE